MTPTERHAGCDRLCDCVGVMSVSILMVRTLVEAVERAGVHRDRLLTAAGIDAAQLDDSSIRLSLAEYDRVQLAALAVSGDEALGLRIGEHASSAAFDVLGHLTEHAATLRQSVETIIRYSHILSVGPDATLCEEGETASIRYAFPHGPSPTVRLVAELATSGLLRLIRLFVGSDARPRGVFFEYEAPAYHAEYTRAFDGVERFGQAFTGIEFDRAWLDRTQLHTNAELYTVLQDQAERALSRVTRSADLAELVRAHLATHDPANMPTMDVVARHCGVSARTLRRRLLAEGVEYNVLLDRVLTGFAKRLLEGPRGSIHETAYAMGFATPAAFHRAFKRWTGMTPTAYKASH